LNIGIKLKVVYKWEVCDWDTMATNYWQRCNNIQSRSGTATNVVIDERSEVTNLDDDSLILS